MKLVSGIPANSAFFLTRSNCLELNTSLIELSKFIARHKRPRQVLEQVLICERRLINTLLQTQQWVMRIYAPLGNIG